MAAKLKTIITFFLAAWSAATLAQSVPPLVDASQAVIRVATAYANSIACPDVVINPQNVAALMPYRGRNRRDEERYAVIWVGDLGCAGGTGSPRTYISIVKVGADDAYVVDPVRSSPNVKIASPLPAVDRIVSHTPDTLTLEGKAYAPMDALCCPSVLRQFTLKSDAAGNWDLVAKSVKGEGK